MEGELWARVDLIEGLNGLTVSLHAGLILREQGLLVQHSVKKPNAPVHEELKHWPVHAREHDRIDQISDIIEPEGTVVRIKPVKQFVDEVESSVADVKAGADLDDTVVQKRDVEDSHHHEPGLICQGQKSHFFSNVDEN